MRRQTKTLGLDFRGNGEPLSFSSGATWSDFCVDSSLVTLRGVQWLWWLGTTVPSFSWRGFPYCSSAVAEKLRTTHETPLQRGFWIRFRCYQLEVSVQDLERGNQARAESLLVVLCVELAGFSAGVSQSQLLLIMAVCQFP